MNCGSRGKIQYLYCQGLIASLSKIRDSVLRLIILPNAFCALREVVQGLPTDGFTGFRNAFTSQGFDQCLIPGGKNDRTAGPCLVLQGKVSCRPAFPPALHLSARQADFTAKLCLVPLGMFMHQQHQL